MFLQIVYNYFESLLSILEISRSDSCEYDILLQKYTKIKRIFPTPYINCDRISQKKNNLHKTAPKIIFFMLFSFVKVVYII